MTDHHPPRRKFTLAAGLRLARYICRLILVFAILLQAAPAFAASDGVQDLESSVDARAASTGKDYYAANLFAIAATGTITNTVSVGSTTTDPNAVNNTAVQTTTVNSVADLQITKTDGIGSLVPGTILTYTIVVSNGGPSAVSDAVVEDPLPTAIASATWSCSAAAGSSCDQAGGSGDINTTVDLAVGGSATFTVVALTHWTAVGSLVNTATITPPVDTTDPNPTDNSSTDTDSLLTGVLTGTVFLDVNNDNTQNGTEGLNGVTLVITTSVGTTFTVTTDSNGYFTVTVPAGTTIVDVDDNDPDLPDGAVQIAGTDPTTVNVPAGGSASDINGYELQGDVYGHIFQDTDGNGVQNGSEADLQNIDVVITDTFGVTQTVTTDANGNYTATVPISNQNTLTDTVTVDVVESTLPAGSIQSAGIDPDTVTVQSGVSTNAGDDGYQPQGLVQGVIYIDEDGDGVYTLGTDRPLGNVTLVITDSNRVTYTVITNAGGAYSLIVPSGDTTVDVDNNDPDLPSGVVLTGGSTDPTTVNVPGGGTATDDTGYVQYSTIGDRLWLDLNGDGIQDANEPGLADVVVKLTRPNGSVITNTTGPSGYYNFSGLLPGSYTVTVDTSTLPSGVTQTGDRDAIFDDQTVLTISSNNAITDADFGYQGNSSIGDLVWRDRNGNGLKTADEPGLSGVVITLTLSNGWVITTTTAGAGAYEFAGLIPGSYTVTVASTTLPVGSVQTSDRDSTLDHETVVNLAVNTAVTNADFGYQRQGELVGFVFEDIDGSGDWTVGEPGLGSVTVIITDSRGVTQSVQTDGNGYYTVTVAIDSNTAPTDTVIVDVDESTLLTLGYVYTAGTDPATITVTANATTDVGDDGYQRQGVVEGYVYEDVNQNGAYDAGTDIPLTANVTITDSNGVTYIVATDVSGYFSQTVPYGATTVNVDDGDVTAISTDLMLEDGSVDPETVNVPAGGTATTNFPYVEPLVIDKDVVTANVMAGEQVTYTIVVRNIGATALTNVTVSDTLPLSFTFAGSTLAAIGASRTATVDPLVGDTIPTWGNWTINAGGAVTIIFVADIASSVTAGVYDNTAYAISDQTSLINDDGSAPQDDNTPTGADPENDEDVTVSTQADLGVVKSDTPDPVAAGGTLTYTIVVTNYGPSDAHNVVITDTLPADVSFIAATGCSLTGSNVVCTLGTIANGTAKRVTIVVTVDQDLLVAAVNTGPALVEAPAGEQAQATLATPVAGNDQAAATALLHLSAAAARKEVLAAATVNRATPAQAGADLLAMAQLIPADTQNTSHQVGAVLNPAGEIFQPYLGRAGPDWLT